MYEVTFNFPNARLGVVESAIVPAEPTFGDDQDNMVMGPVTAADNKPERRYPKQMCRSVIGHQPYDMYVPRTIF